MRRSFFTEEFKSKHEKALNTHPARRTILCEAEK